MLRTSALALLAMTRVWGLDAAAIDMPTLQAQLTTRAAGDAPFLTGIDLDRDGVISQLESIVWLYGHQTAARRDAAGIFAGIDGDSDRRISRAEILQVVERTAQTGFSVQAKRKSVRPDRAMPQGGGNGTSVGVGGSRAYVFFGEQHAYIQDYNIVNGQYDPVIGILGTGVVLDVGDLVITVNRPVR